MTRYRELAKADPATYQPELGLALCTLCGELNGTAGPVFTSYIDLLEEGIALHRRLLRRNPSSVPQLGLMLCWLGVAQFRLGWNAKARDLMEEGVGVIRRMAHDRYDLWEPQLATALALVSAMLGKTGDHSSALSAARESVAIWRQLAEEYPGKHDYYLALALHTLCFVLQDAGRHDETLAPAEESVRITRRLRARGSGAAYARLLANGLDLQVAALGHRERWQDALPVAEEAVHSYQEARRNGDRRNSLTYATSLNNLSKIFSLLGRETEAKTYANMAFTECAKRTRDTDNLADLSIVASDIAGVMTSLGMTWNAKMLIKAVNLRLNPPQPGRLGKLIARLRRR